MTEHELLAFSGICLAGLLSVIAYFLNRMVTQVDNLTDAVADVNATMLKIHGDLSSDVNVLKSEHADLNTRLKDLDPLWDRMRAVENDLARIGTKCSSVVHQFRE